MNNYVYDYLVPDVLYHHGILGQKWGVRRGKNYPLSENQHSPSEKKAEKKKYSRKEYKNDINKIKNLNSKVDLYDKATSKAYDKYRQEKQNYDIWKTDYDKRRVRMAELSKNNLEDELFKLHKESKNLIKELKLKYGDTSIKEAEHYKSKYLNYYDVEDIVNKSYSKARDVEREEYKKDLAKRVSEWNYKEHSGEDQNYLIEELLDSKGEVTPKEYKKITGKNMYD